VASLAIATVVRQGWFGKVVKDRADLGEKFKRNGESVENRRGTADVELVAGTSNVGRFGGRGGASAGEATNVVTDYVHIQGESRSHDARFAKVISAAYREAFQAAAQQVRDDEDRPAKVKFTARLDYHPFRLADGAAVVRHAARAVEAVGLSPALKVANGGLDANWLVRHKLPTVTLGAGQNAIHTVDEFVDLNEFAAGCRLAVALAGLAAQGKE
jgi:tripeptide aminopeptidase